MSPRECHLSDLHDPLIWTRGSISNRGCSVSNPMVSLKFLPSVTVRIKFN
jgi:hypothetical protein